MQAKSPYIKGFLRVLMLRNTQIIVEKHTNELLTLRLIKHHHYKIKLPKRQIYSVFLILLSLILLNKTTVVLLMYTNLLNN